eukprot:gene6328-12806_t
MDAAECVCTSSRLSVCVSRTVMEKIASLLDTTFLTNEDSPNIIKPISTFSVQCSPKAHSKFHGCHVGPAHQRLQMNSKPSEGSQSSIKKGLATLIASAATMQAFMGNAVAAPKFDENFEKISQSLVEKLGKARMTESSAVVINTDGSKGLDSKSMNAIETIITTDFKTFRLDPYQMDSKAAEIRESIRILSTDWRAWVCAIALVVSVDAAKSATDSRRLSQQQKDLIDDLYSKLKLTEVEGFDKTENINELEKKAKQSAIELESLSLQLMKRTKELESMRVQLDELQELDGDLIQTAQMDSNAMQQRLQLATEETEKQQLFFEQKMSETSEELQKAKKERDQLQKREADLLDALKAFLVNQQYIGQGVANMLLPATLPSFISQIRVGITPKEMETRMIMIGNDKTALQAKLTKAEETIASLNSKLSEAYARIESNTNQQLDAMKRSGGDKARIAKQEKDISILKQMLTDAKAQLAESDAAAEQALEAASTAVQRAEEMEREIIRLTAVISKLENYKVEAFAAAAESIDKQSKEWEAKLQVTTDRLNVALAAESALSTARWTIGGLNRELEQVKSHLAATEGINAARVTAENTVKAQAMELAVLKEELQQAKVDSNVTEVLRATVATLVADLEATNKKLADASTKVLSRENVERELLKLSIENSDLRSTLAVTEKKLAASEDRVSAIALKLERLEHMMQVSMVENASPEAGEYIKELSVENEDLKQKLLVSEDRLWEMQQQSEDKLDEVKLLARELSAKVGVTFLPSDLTPELAAAAASSVTSSRPQQKSISSTSTSTQGSSSSSASVSAPRTYKKKLTDQELQKWEMMNDSQLMKKSKVEIEDVLRSLGERKPLSKMQKSDMISLLKKKLSLSTVRQLLV